MFLGLGRVHRVAASAPASPPVMPWSLRLRAHAPPRVGSRFWEQRYSQRLETPGALCLPSSHSNDAGRLGLWFAEGRWRATTSVPACPSFIPRNQAHLKLSLPPPPPLWVSDHNDGGILLSATATATTDGVRASSAFNLSLLLTYLLVKLGVLCLFAGSPCLNLSDALKSQAYSAGARAAVVRYVPRSVPLGRSIFCVSRCTYTCPPLTTTAIRHAVSYYHTRTLIVATLVCGAFPDGRDRAALGRPELGSGGRSTFVWNVAGGGVCGCGGREHRSWRRYPALLIPVVVVQRVCVETAGAFCLHRHRTACTLVHVQEWLSSLSIGTPLRCYEEPEDLERCPSRFEIFAFLCWRAVATSRMRSRRVKILSSYVYALDSIFSHPQRLPSLLARFGVLPTLIPARPIPLRTRGITGIVYFPFLRDDGVVRPVTFLSAPWYAAKAETMESRIVMRKGRRVKATGPYLSRASGGSFFAVSLSWEMMHVEARGGTFVESDGSLDILRVGAEFSLSYGLPRPSLVGFGSQTSRTYISLAGVHINAKKPSPSFAVSSVPHIRFSYTPPRLSLAACRSQTSSL
ncbi:hypothetical protein R3P38DRAFT_3167426 [Favolaschia claudopus]|uniref:Uncharacterized protein n=1 Tax=Favolaschia claudopus TaxID=2862362 RepID=A0AAW0EC78_9AGAR